MSTRIKHFLGLLGTIAIPLLTVWGDAGTELPVKIAVSIALVIPLIWSDPLQQRKVTTAILAGIPVATIIVSAIASRMSGEAVGGAAVAVVLAVLTQLRKVLATTSTVATAQEIIDNSQPKGPPCSRNSL
jgi:hypothetical protein